ncbi:MAG: acetate--CoA ligase family protein, partial [Gaiellaceae bacterium]
SCAYPESAARALGRVCQRADWLRASSGTVPALNGIDQAAATEIIERALGDDATDAWLVPDYARGLLEAYGIPMVGERVVESVDDAVSAAAELGYPVVVKTAAAGAHKTEHGGVALDLEDEEAVRAAVAQIGLPVLLQPMVKGGAELLAGVVQDPMFGPLVAFGPGGVFAELIGQAGFRLAPLTDVDARELVTSGKAGTLVAGFRGRPPSDERALVELVLRLARLAEDLPEVAELDLNPVVGLEHGCVAVDARIRVSRATGQSGQLKTW